MNSLIRKPSAWIPVLIPLVFFAYLVAYIAIYGIVRKEDEGAGAHLFQLWLVLEPFMLGFFAIKWLPREPKRALLILVLQIVIALLPIFVVFYFNL